MAADAALVLVDGVAGVEVQTEKVWSFADEFKLPRAIVINKLDRERSSFERALESVQQVFGRAAIPIQLPIGAEREFKGVVDLVRMKAYTYTLDGDGKGKEGDIPAESGRGRQSSARSAGRNGGRGQRRAAGRVLRQGHAAGGAYPRRPARRRFASGASSRCCAPPALHNVASRPDPELRGREFPRPGRSRAVERDAERRPKSSASIKDSEPVSAFVFKTVADPFAGRVSYFKVISGVVKNDANLVNARSGATERLAHIGALFGQDHSAGYRTARRRYRRRREAEGDADRRHAGRQSRR